MKILSVAFPLLPVSSGSAGGAEQILYLLERELVKRGHQSLVIAAQGSQVSGQLIASPAANGEITDQIREEAQQAHRQLIGQALDDFDVDLIHFHGLDFDAYAPCAETRARKLATLHLPINWYSEKIFRIPGMRFNCVSRSQSVSIGHSFPVVSNGVDVKRYHATALQKEYLLWIGRICPEKGTDIALRVAHQLNESLIIAGPVHPFRYHQLYFEEKVRYLFDEQRRYAGPVDLEQKIQLLGKAKCLLVPSLAPETSSLVAMEALSAGVPVVAFRSGALPEIIHHGRTGFIIDSEQEIAEAITQCSRIDPEECRREAQNRFAAERMACDYEKLYQEICA